MNLSLSFPLKRYIVSFFGAFLITIVIAGIISALFSFFDVPVWLSALPARFLCYFSAFAAAFLSTKGAEKNGLVTGILSADIYMLVLLLAGMIFFGSGFPPENAVKIFSLCSFTGAAGGILGINI